MDRSYNLKVHACIIFFALVLILCFFISSSQAHENKTHPNVSIEEVEYEGCEYVIFSENGQISAVHEGNCPNTYQHKIHIQ